VALTDVEHDLAVQRPYSGRCEQHRITVDDRGFRGARGRAIVTRVKPAICTCLALAIGCGPPSPGDAVPSELRFAVIGDTRPPAPDDTAHYPSEVATAIWRGIAAESPPVAFAISTGDYMFATTSRREQAAQLALYGSARAAFGGPLYPAMGNHECTGATASNCGDGNADGATANYTAFVDGMLAPIGEHRPYYARRIAGAGFTAKLVFVACNAWDDAQARWLDDALAEPTTYTFVVRHEPVAALAESPCAASAAIVDAHPLTLLVAGHTHSYYRSARHKEIVVGNGGAPLTTGTSYGYVVVSRETSGAIVVTAYDAATHATLDTFAIDAAGERP
jgi:hypothetical protein